MTSNRAASPATQEARRRRTAHTFEWLYGVNEDTGLQACDTKVALALTRHFNEDKHGGAAWPSYKTIADAIGVSEATVIRSVRRLHARGHLRVEWGQQGRGHPNRYWMAAPEKPARAKVSEAEKPAPAQARKPSPVSRKPSPVKENLLKNHRIGEAKASPYTDGRENAHEVRSSPPAAARAPERGAAAGRERGSKTDAAEKEFRELRAVWVRPWADNDDREARRAFAAALDEGADAEEIIAAAMEWVRLADAPRFLPTLSKWLTARRWETPPPQRRTRAPGRSGEGNGRKPGKPDMAKMFLKRGGYAQQADGTMACALPDGSTSICNWGGVQ